MSELHRASDLHGRAPIVRPMLDLGLRGGLHRLSPQPQLSSMIGHRPTF